MSDVPADCAHVNAELAELALGTLVGRERADVLSHLELCPRCAAELDLLSGVADSLLSVVPGVDPPVGFEVRVLGEMGLTVRRRPQLHRRVLLGASALALALAGFIVGLVLAPSSPGQTEAATVFAAGRQVGSAVIAPGHPGLLSVTVVNLVGVTEVHCSISTGSGQIEQLGRFWLDGGSASWSVPLTLRPGAVKSAVLTSMTGKVVARAVFAT